MSKLGVLILAAGNSSRMGVPKQLLKWKGTNLLQHTINVVNEVNSENVLVLGANFEKIERNIKTDDIAVLFNENWKNGLGSSIVVGVNYIKESFPNIESVLIMLADQPLIDSNFLKELISIQSLNTNKIICTLYQNNRFGVPAIFNKTYFEDLLQLKDDKGAKELIQKYSNEVMSLNGINLTSDIDTLTDYEELYKKHH
ncbi:nucleotidyltransferase family protein [Yeosuana sp.]|uniref:nucleotidyltransferase family protein n=1 Tax=Yeosuana sp. TaxID=2529388 RepID=UPI0040550A64